MAKYSVSCKINYDPARVFDWAAKLEQQKRARIPFSINPADVDRQPPTEHTVFYHRFTVIPGGRGGRSHTRHPGQSPDPMDAATVAEAVAAGAAGRPCSDGSGTAVVVPRGNDRAPDLDVLQWGDWLARPFPDVTEIFQQDGIDITLITDLMHFTVQQVGPASTPSCLGHNRPLPSPLSTWLRLCSYRPPEIWSVDLATTA